MYAGHLYFFLFPLLLSLRIQLHVRNLYALKKYLRTLAHQLLLPRGRSYHSDTSLETGWEKISISRGHSFISALVRGPETKVAGTVVLSHPYLSDAKQFFLKRGHAGMYLELGYRVVLFDYNGFGESPFQDFSYESDIKAVVTYVKNQYREQSLTGHGVSFGASHVITYSTFSDQLFDSIIIENCLDSNLSYYKKRNKALHLLMLSLMRFFPGINRHHDYIKSISCLAPLKKVLFIYNTHDDLTTINMGNQLSAACNMPGDMAIFEGKHLNAFQDNKKKYTRLITSFLKDLK